MGILSPLYLLGALALALPLYLHLKRRPPRERIPFSSLMFLKPTRAVRVARTSKLEQLGLLTLRCLALLALVAAFARPFWNREGGGAAAVGEGQRLVLVDASASMGRGGAWGEARDAAGREAAADGSMVWTFGDSVRRVFPEPVVEGAGGVAGSAFSVDLLGEPGGGGTALGAALAEAADELEGSGGGEVVLVSDLQSGASLDGLQSAAWPEGVRVRLVPVGQEGWSVAASWVAPLPDGTPRVRLAVPGEAGPGGFELTWEDPSGTTASEPLAVTVAPGQSRVVAVPWPAGLEPGGGAILRVVGDGEAFDDTLAYAPPVSTVTPVFVAGGREAERKPDDPVFFLVRALGGDARRSFRFTQDPGEAAAFFVTEAVDGALLEGVVQRVVEGGVPALVVATPETAGLLERLTGDAVEVGDPVSGRYAMLEGLAFDHPLLSAFADAEVRDFSKIRFWRRNALTVPPGASVLAGFDGGGVAWVAVPAGLGQAVVLASGWAPGDSQLALSSKFVPLLFSILEGSGAIPTDSGAFFTVGKPAGLSALAGGDGVTVRPAGERSGGSGVAAGGSYVFDAPGLYEVEPAGGGAAFVVAANLTAGESDLTPMTADELEALGVVLAGRRGAGGKAPADAREPRGDEVSAREQAMELESQQKLWRWVVVLLMVALVAESWLAGRRGAVIEPSELSPSQAR